MSKKEIARFIAEADARIMCAEYNDFTWSGNKGVYADAINEDGNYEIFGYEIEVQKSKPTKKSTAKKDKMKKMADFNIPATTVNLPDKISASSPFGDIEEAYYDEDSKCYQGTLVVATYDGPNNDILDVYLSYSIYPTFSADEGGASVSGARIYTDVDDSHAKVRGQSNYWDGNYTLVEALSSVVWGAWEDREYFRSLLNDKDWTLRKSRAKKSMTSEELLARMEELESYADPKEMERINNLPFAEAVQALLEMESKRSAENWSEYNTRKAKKSKVKKSRFFELAVDLMEHDFESKDLDNPNVIQHILQYRDVTESELKEIQEEMRGIENVFNENMETKVVRKSKMKKGDYDIPDSYDVNLKGVGVVNVPFLRWDGGMYVGQIVDEEIGLEDAWYTFLGTFDYKFPVFTDGSPGKVNFAVTISCNPYQNHCIGTIEMNPVNEIIRVDEEMVSNRITGSIEEAWAEYIQALNKSKTYNPAINPAHAYNMCLKAQNEQGRMGLTKDAIFKILGFDPTRMLKDYKDKIRTVSSKDGTVYIFDKKVV
jgi:hypothetical protein